MNEAAKDTKFKPGNPHRFKPNDPRRSNGRPKNAGLSIIEALNVVAGRADKYDDVRAYLQRISKGQSVKKNKAAIMAAAHVWLRLIEEGGLKDLELVMNYTNGRPSQGVELTGKDGGAIQTEAKTTLVLPQTATEDDWQALIERRSERAAVEDN
ncbi:MAG: hypothetical protein AAF663_09045 [Planctomycetota bacterium]